MSANRAMIQATEFCALPLVRRASQALVVGLAAFLLTLIILRERFHGYLAEVHLAGPAAEGLDLDAAAAWIKKLDAKVAVAATPAGEISPKSQIRVTLVSPRPGMATVRLDGLAERWLYQYLPERLQAYRHESLREVQGALALARGREETARQQLDALRQWQLAQLLRTAETQREAAPASEPARPVVATPQETESTSRIREKLATLKLELSQLLAHFTDEHPQVVGLRTQIAALEQQLALPPTTEGSAAPTGPQLSQPTAERQVSAQPAVPGQGREHFISTTATVANSSEAPDGLDPELSQKLNSAAQAAAQASRDRQAAEQRLTLRMQELTLQPSAAQWSAGPAAIVTRLGGTPRSSTVILGLALALVVGIAIFRAAPGGASPLIETPRELASILELPVVGNAIALRGTAAQLRRRLLTPARVRLIVRGAEITVLIAVCACFVAMAFEPSLARQVLADPFGTLSEVIGRFIH